MRLKLILVFLVLTGCQSVQDETLVQSGTQEDQQGNSTIQKAELDLAIAIESGAEWRVRDYSTGDDPVSLSSLLHRAWIEFDNGNKDEANRIASRVSMMARLGLDQQQRNRSSMPNYYFDN